MAAFATIAAAETRAVAQVEAGTWVVAHPMRQNDGTIAVRFQRFMAATSVGSKEYGDWTETSDDATD